MYVELDIPDISAYPNGFPQYWLKAMFVQAPSGRYQINALTTSYVRLVEAALVEYRAGAVKLREYWNTHSSLNLGAMNRSVSHFEACISDMHRATNCFRRLRGDREQDPIARMLRTDKASFATDTVWDRLRNVRNEVHHMDEMLIKNEITTGQPFALHANGPETLHPTESKQTIKKIDRLVIGSREIRFTELAEWLQEMGEAAAKLADHIPSSSTAASS